MKQAFFHSLMLLAFAAAFFPGGKKAAAERGALSPAPVRPALLPLSGTFYHFPGNEWWSRERWGRELGWMQELGMDTIVLASAVEEHRDATKAYYPSTIAGFTIVSGDPIGKILSEADQRGMSVHLMVYDTYKYWTHYTTNFYDELTRINKAVASDLYAQYGQHPSLKGFYLIPEFWYPANTLLRGLWIDHYYKPVTAHIKTLNPRLQTSCAPFVGSPAGYEAGQYEDFLKQMLGSIPNLDLLMLQDGLGANEGTEASPNGRPLAFIDNIFARSQAACAATSRTLWGDLEAFEAVGVPYPPHISRITDQIATLSPYVSKLVTFEWAYLSPAGSISALEFNLNYKRHLKGEPYLDDIARERPYTLSIAPDPAYPDAGQRLTDGGKDSRKEACVGWQNGPAINVTIDLGRSERAISLLAASFYHELDQGIARPREVRVSSSLNGTDFKAIGAFAGPLVDERGHNVYTLPLANPIRARYVRYAMTPADATKFLLCSELAVFSTVPDLISRNRAYTLSQSPAPDYADTTRKLTNGDTASRWYAQVGWKDLASTLTLTMDLEKPYALERVEAFFLRQDADSVALPKAVRLEVSSDGQHFTRLPVLQATAPKDNASNGFGSDVRASARYVRLKVETGGAWLMINEFKIFGRPLSNVAGSTRYGALRDGPTQKKNTPAAPLATAKLD